MACVPGWGLYCAFRLPSHRLVRGQLAHTLPTCAYLSVISAEQHRDRCVVAWRARRKAGK